MSNDRSKSASETADERHLELAREEGEAYQRSFRHVARDVAHAGDETRAGDYVIGFAQELAEGTYAPGDGGGLEWIEPQTENCHLEVGVADAADGRFVPHLSVSATLVTPDADEIGPVDLPFVWDPGASHYGANLTVPGDGIYDVEVHVEPASFHRRDRDNGARFDEPVLVRFEGVDVACGQR